MPIVVNGTTITTVNVNGSPINIVNVNGTEVYRSGTVAYNAIQLNGSGSAYSPNVREARMYWATGQYYNTFCGDMESWTSSGYGEGVIFKDFTYIRATIYSHTTPTHEIMYGTCTKSASLSNVIKNGTGRINYSTIYIAGGETKIIEIYGDGNSDCFIGLTNYNVGTGSGAVQIKTDDDGGIRGYRSY